MAQLKYLILISFVLSACAGPGVKKVVVDASPNRPDWLEQAPSFEKDNRHYFKSLQVVRGDQRLKACYEIAGADNRESMIRSMVESMKGATDEAQTSAAENAEIVLGKARSGAWSGKIYGFRDDDYFFERYQIRDEATNQITERIDCYTLSSVGKADYARTKSEILNQLVAVDQKVKDAITSKQVNFFEDKSDRQPASVPKEE